MFSTIFSRRDGLDALLCIDPAFDDTLEKIDESANEQLSDYDLVVEAGRFAGIRTKSVSEILDENYDAIEENSSEDDYYDTGVDLADYTASEIHDAMGYCIGDSMNTGEMIDQLMGDYVFPDGMRVED